MPQLSVVTRSPNGSRQPMMAPVVIFTMLIVPLPENSTGGPLGGPSRAPMGPGVAATADASTRTRLRVNCIVMTSVVENQLLTT
jgi:hypothetical protein